MLSSYCRTKMSNPGNDGMLKLISVVNQLHDTFSATGITFGLELPQIAVVGGQSAGKSSVLENFVGRDFLPRGAGIVTRRPLVLQLHHSSEEYAEFLHQPSRKYTDFNQVRLEIEAETDRETGHNKGISSKPINLKVYSPNVLDLTLVDLPGMTRIPVGDQPPDIEIQIRQLVMEYVSKENTLILAVSPANNDLANSDALRVAREVDPSGDRTIGVVTKVDLMDEGTDASAILRNEVFPLKRGYVAVVNRSQKDIEGQKNIKLALECEKAFFIGHPSYSDMADRLGTPYLQQVLNKELSRHIQKTLNSMRAKLRTKLLDLKKEMATLTDSSPEGLNTTFISLVQEFGEEVQTEIEGMTAEIDTEQLGGGAKINRLFYKEFADALSMDHIPANVLHREIAFAIRNIHAVRCGIFTPDMAFIATVTKIISRYKAPTGNCVGLVSEVLKEIIKKCLDKTFMGYDRLREEVEFLVNERIQEHEQIAKKMLGLYVEAEMAFINTRHEDFIGKTVQTREENQDTPKYIQSIASIKRKLDDTSKIIRKGWLLHSKKVNGVAGGLQWFVLAATYLSWYLNEKEEDTITILPLNSKIKLQTEKDTKISLYVIDGKKITPELKTLELVAQEVTERDDWVLHLRQAGVLREGELEPNNMKKPDAESIAKPVDTSNVKHRKNGDEVRSVRRTNVGFTRSMADPEMDRETGMIRLMVESYLKIVSKTIRDLVPKFTMSLLVDKVERFVIFELLSKLQMEHAVSDLMMETTGDSERRKELERACKVAEDTLKVIGDSAPNRFYLH